MIKINLVTKQPIWEVTRHWRIRAKTASEAIEKTKRDHIHMYSIVANHQKRPDAKYRVTKANPVL